MMNGYTNNNTIHSEINFFFIKHQNQVKMKIIIQ